ncbi:helix-turn-helix domain-containing protein [Siccirubricoccus deserti]
MPYCPPRVTSRWRARRHEALPRTDPPAGDAARLGEELREARMALGLGLEDLAASLRIRRVYLSALEEGRVQDLPAPAYAIGFVRSYARALGLDEDDTVRRFRDSIGPVVPRKTDLVFPEPVPDRGVPAGAVMLVGAVLAVGAYAVWYIGRATATAPWMQCRRHRRRSSGRRARPARRLRRRRQWSCPCRPRPPDPPADSGPPAATTPVPPAPAALPSPAPPARPEEGRVLLRAKADTWLQVRDRQTGAVLLNRVLRPGESWAVPPREGLTLSTGNAGGLEILVDGELTPGLGAAQSVRRDLPLDPVKLKSGRPPASASGPRPVQ